MLTQLRIRNYAIVAQLDIELHRGMTVVTGETGAGKSIMLDALGLCLGDRADSRAIKPGTERAEVIACFDIQAITPAKEWLANHDLGDGDDCILRRVITAEGRSRAYINGTPSTLHDCAALGALLIDIHSQHAHQSLLRREFQRRLLDAYAGSQGVAATVGQLASDWLRSRADLDLLRGARNEQTARAQLLSYQVEELDALALAEGELATLEARQKTLANAEHILSSAGQALELCEQQESGLRRALALLEDDSHNSKPATEARELLDSAAIQLGEARSEIQHHIDTVAIDPEQLQEVQQRLESIYDIARKHRVNPEQVPGVHEQLARELAGLSGGESRIEELQEELLSLQADYAKQAAALGKARRSAARKLIKQVSARLAELSMGNCELQIALEARADDDPHPQGAEDIEFRISTNPGAAPQPLGRIASGGELSRISLAIQVVTASASAIPSMVFDEVDVGIGGATAEVVGRQLRDLSARTQVLCVTHLPQVAAQGHQHLQVSKQGDKRSVETSMHNLADEDRVAELARMLGGVKLTEQTLAHAREMLEQAAAG